MYTLKELFDNLDITLTELKRRSGISDVTLISIRNGNSARRSTINTLLKTFSEIYGVKLTLKNVEGITIQGKPVTPTITPTRIDETPPTDTATQQEEAQISTVEPSSDMVRLSDFAKLSGIPLRTLHNWRETGKIEATQQNRPHGGGIEYFLTPEQQEKAKLINSLRAPRKSK
jgi:predicted transcriptional regulator